PARRRREMRRRNIACTQITPEQRAGSGSDQGAARFPPRAAARTARAEVGACGPAPLPGGGDTSLPRAIEGRTRSAKQLLHEVVQRVLPVLGVVGVAVDVPGVRDAVLLQVRVDALADADQAV